MVDTFNILHEVNIYTFQTTIKAIFSDKCMLKILKKSKVEVTNMNASEVDSTLHNLKSGRAKIDADQKCLFLVR